MDSVTNQIPDSVFIPSKHRPNGPIASERLRRFNIGYVVACLLGALPTLFGWDSGWQAFGWGLWFPGAGFIAIGGWGILAAIFTAVLFALAFIAWFGSGMIVAPVIVWLGAAIVAGFAIDQSTWSTSHWLIPLLTAGVVFYLGNKNRQSFEKQLAKAAERNQILPQAYQDMRAAQTQDVTGVRHELDEQQLATLRWLLDRALQPIGELNGFTRIDQFQTSALRYQLNFIGYALGMCQRHYTPNFHGYMSEAQRRLIEQYLQPQICNYWRLENAWGNLNLSADPVGKDNIMLTGYFNIQVCMYMNNTGDMRYAEPGSLTFKVSDKLSFPHDAHTINQSLLDNFRSGQEQYCLYPCEPNWIYPACNMFGMNSMTAYDVVFGTDQVSEFREDFRSKLESEFVTTDGSVVPLRSQLTGHALPFPAPDSSTVVLLSSIYPDLAERYWTLTRHEVFVEEDGETKIALTVPPVDFGNYKKGYLLLLDSIMGSAVEFGDQAAAKVVQSEIDKHCVEKNEAGRRYYDESTMGNASHARTVFGFKHSWRDAVSTPAPKTALEGPLLAEVNFPETLVARAVSNSGDDLEMVLVGEESASHKLRFERLAPGKTYSLSGETLSENITADQDGKAQVEIAATGRLTVNLEPVS